MNISQIVYIYGINGTYYNKLYAIQIVHRELKVPLSALEQKGEN